MTPYYDDGTCVIYHGDCRDVLSDLDLTADLLIADPPYGVAWKSNRGGDRFDVLMGDDGSLDLIECMNVICRRLRRGRHAYVFGFGPEDLPDSLPLCGKTELIWDKEILGLGDLASPWGPSHEKMTFAVVEISQANRDKGYGLAAARLRKGSVLRVQRNHSAQTNRHPTEKPVELLRVLIESSSTFDELVLDPFMGSGSTLEAARLEGRRAVGIDIDEGWCEVAAKRFAQGVLAL